ncbi:hypothetical protein D3C81_1075100 [compost metagenome]
MVIFFLRTSVSRKSLVLVALSRTGLIQGFSGSLKVPRIEAKVSSAWDSMLANAERALLLRNGRSERPLRNFFRSLPSPEDRRYTAPRVGVPCPPGKPLLRSSSQFSNRYRVKAMKALRAWLIQNFWSSEPSGYSIAPMLIRSDTRNAGSSET